MTQIDFYTGVEDKMHTACRLAAKAYSLNLRVMVFCSEAESAHRFDRLLWTTPATGFIPHCFSGDPLAPVTPVIVDHDSGDSSHDQVLLNLRAEWPPFFSRFQRLIEIVTLNDEDKANARERYKFYRDRGYEIRTHDLSKADQ
ncbi:MAG: DNA polymerase III subunit chi [Burkholderiales bacterium]|nr:DNA polymerase III subunit chi [Burkholderiales bacterium]